MLEISGVVGVPMVSLLTVKKAACVLRIDWSRANQLAAGYDSSDGLSGMLTIGLGACRRAPRSALFELALTARLSDADVVRALRDRGHR